MGNILYAPDLRTYSDLKSALPFLAPLEFTAKDSAKAKGFKFNWLPYQDELEEPLPCPRRLAIRLRMAFQSICQQASWQSSMIIVTNGLSFGITVEALAHLRKPPKNLALIAFYPQSDVLTGLQQAIPTDEDFQRYVPRNTLFPIQTQCRDRATYFRNAAKSRFDFIDVCAEAAHKLTFCELILPPHNNDRRIPPSVLDFYNAANGIMLNTELPKDCTHKDQSAVLRDSIYRAVRRLG